MLRTAGLDTYAKWATHQIPFNDPSVLNAAKIFGNIMFHPGYVLGGADQTPSIAFGDAPLPMFDKPPGCWLHRQASFINAFFPDDGEGRASTTTGSRFHRSTRTGRCSPVSSRSTFRNAPEVKDFLNALHVHRRPVRDGRRRRDVEDLAERQRGTGLLREPDPRRRVGDPDERTEERRPAGFDASDMMPPAVGSGSFWTGMVKYMKEGPDSIQGILDDIEKSWPTS